MMPNSAAPAATLPVFFAGPPSARPYLQALPRDLDTSDTPAGRLVRGDAPGEAIGLAGLLPPDVGTVPEAHRRLLAIRIAGAAGKMSLAADRPLAVTEVLAGGGWQAAQVVNHLLAAGHTRLHLTLIDPGYPSALHGSHAMPLDPGSPLGQTISSSDPVAQSVQLLLARFGAWAREQPEASLTLSIWPNVSTYAQFLRKDPSLASDVVYSAGLPYRPMAVDEGAPHANLAVGADFLGGFYAWVPETLAPHAPCDLARSPHLRAALPIMPGLTIEGAVHPYGWLAAAEARPDHRPEAHVVPSRAAMVAQINQLRSTAREQRSPPEAAEKGKPIWLFDPRAMQNEICHLARTVRPHGMAYMLTDASAQIALTTVPMRDVVADRGVPQLGGRWEGCSLAMDGRPYPRYNYGEVD